MGWGQWEEGITGTTIKTHGQNQGGGWKCGRKWGSSGVGLSDGDKRHTTVIE